MKEMQSEKNVSVDPSELQFQTRTEDTKQELDRRVTIEEIGCH